MPGHGTEDGRALEAGLGPGSVPYLLCGLESITWPLWVFVAYTPRNR